MRIRVWCVFVLAFVLGWHSPVQAYAQGFSSADSAIWQIEDDSNYGTAFAISPNLFITNAHNLRDARRIGEIVLSQEGNAHRLSVSQVLALSLVHDLLLLQTKETVRRYLRLGGPVSKKEDGTLHMMGYRKQTLTHFRQIAPITWQDRFYYALPVNKINLSGASGSPILGSAGKVVAIASRASKYISYGLKSQYIRRLLVGDIGIFCSRPHSIRSCRDDGIAKMVEMSERGHVLRNSVLVSAPIRTTKNIWRDSYANRRNGASCRPCRSWEHIITIIKNSRKRIIGSSKRRKRTIPYLDTIWG